MKDSNSEFCSTFGSWLECSSMHDFDLVLCELEFNIQFLAFVSLLLWLYSLRMTCKTLLRLITLNEKHFFLRLLSIDMQISIWDVSFCFYYLLALCFAMYGLMSFTVTSAKVIGFFERSKRKIPIINN
jgi:hypothetical protein